MTSEITLNRGVEFNKFAKIYRKYYRVTRINKVRGFCDKNGKSNNKIESFNGILKTQYCSIY